MPDTPNIGTPLLAADQAQKHVTHNEALMINDAVTQLTVINTTTTAPPGAPTEGDTYIIGDSATGDWASKDGEIASFIIDQWVYVAPREGWFAYDQSAGIFLKFDGSSWVNASPAAGGSFGVQQFQSALADIALAADTWTDMTNDGAGSQTSTAGAVAGHGAIWNVSTNRFNFTDLKVGDLVRLKMTFEIITPGARDIDFRLLVGAAEDVVHYHRATYGGAIALGEGDVTLYFPLRIYAAGVATNPAKVQVRGSGTCDVALRDIVVETQVN